MDNIAKDIERVLLSEEEIAARVAEISADITRDYGGKNPLLISVLRGSFIFMADLVRSLPIECTLDFMAVSSYGKKSATTGAVKITKDLDLDIEGRHVIIVEDILDSGLTLSFMMELMSAKRPASIRLCTLLDKPARRQKPIQADYVGFEVPDEFVVGYGLDYADKYRNLPYIGVLKPCIYCKE
ncbi:hypoxanthine phosphoribosyltransferase [Papillibacter cinnamivorans]|uniref:Hypoxanthine phosphoribosyltransferase n=1 Tax=Papillibacter cinnamivorans DSM 12816 TaxID=1122930 RepID=A0A1W2D0N8_9FIRM|nr:hypoxanthine phosphoribosyltransferase [Papillibacter cinnamivorans]SMC90662.1 hypoxanthine phosphoribosyltransferase [Papillibacter cinnamivorans DSM 12816]